MNDGGEDDAKVLAVPSEDPRFAGIKDISDVESHTLEEIQHFFKVYKDLEKKEVKVGDWANKEKAEEAIEHSLKAYNEKFQK